MHLSTLAAVCQVSDLEGNPLKSKRCEGLEPFHLSSEPGLVRMWGYASATPAFAPRLTAVSVSTKDVFLSPVRCPVDNFSSSAGNGAS